MHEKVKFCGNDMVWEGEVSDLKLIKQLMSLKHLMTEFLETSKIGLDLSRYKTNPYNSQTLVKKEVCFSQNHSRYDKLHFASSTVMQ
jgi:hypothetical protein